MPEPSDLIRAAIESANRDFERTYRAGDPAAVAKLYTEEAQLFPTGSGVVTGHAAIAEFWRGVMDLGIAGARLETGEVDHQGDTAIETGRYTLYGEARHELDRGKYLVVWKRARGGWRLHRDIWNTSVAPAG